MNYEIGKIEDSVYLSRDSFWLRITFIVCSHDLRKTPSHPSAPY